MFKLTAKQFYEYLPVFILENNDEIFDIPSVLYSYLIPNKIFHKFITEEMIQAWHKSVDWNKERDYIVEHINWYVPQNSDFTRDLEEWLICNGVASFSWETENIVYVDLELDDYAFANYVFKNFKYVEKHGAVSRTSNYKLIEYVEEVLQIKELINEN